MEHSFDIEIAQEYGMESAIILKHLYYWIEKNRVCEKHCYDGKYWTYGSIKAFCELFPYIGEKKMRNTFQKLEENGLLITGNYNKSQYDRTKWYTLTEKGISIITKQKIDSAKGQMTFGEKANGKNQKGEPIPDIITDIETDNNIIICSESEEPTPNSSISLPLNDKSFYDVPIGDIENWKDAFPAVDIESQLKRMIVWLNANPTKKKTRRGINRFIVSWLSKEQDSGRNVKNKSDLEEWSNG